jgi:hypothetical protein
MTKMLLLHDGRAKAGDPDDDATPLDTAFTEQQARLAGRTTWAQHDAVWYEYDVNGETLLNGRIRWDLPPAG